MLRRAQIPIFIEAIQTEQEVRDIRIISACLAVINLVEKGQDADVSQ